MYDILKNISIVASLTILTCCGPKSGTPEHVLARLREGHTVGAANMELLTKQHLNEMMVIVNDPKAPRMARLQIVERLTRLDVDDSLGLFGRLLNHRDPEVRIIACRWLGSREEPKTAHLLFHRLKVESEEVVRDNIVSVLRRIGVHTQEPEPAFIAKLVDQLVISKSAMPRTFAHVAGGWRGKKVIDALKAALASSDKRLQSVAAASLVGPVVRELDLIAPVYRNMLDHSFSKVRAAGLMGFTSSTCPGRIRIKECCAEKPTLTLLGAMPDLATVIEKFKGREDIEQSEKKLAQELGKCFAKHAIDNSTDQAS